MGFLVLVPTLNCVSLQLDCHCLYHVSGHCVSAGVDHLVSGLILSWEWCICPHIENLLFILCKGSLSWQTPPPLLAIGWPPHHQGTHWWPCLLDLHHLAALLHVLRDDLQGEVGTVVLWRNETFKSTSSSCSHVLTSDHICCWRKHWTSQDKFVLSPPPSYWTGVRLWGSLNYPYPVVLWLLQVSQLHTRSHFPEMLVGSPCNISWIMEIHMNVPTQIIR